MNSFFRKLPLSIKLMLIGIIPVLFLIYLSNQLYDAKKQNVKLIEDYIEHLHKSGNIASLINELENERRYSYEYALKKDGYGNLMIQRPRTDAAIKLLGKSQDLAIKNFTQYTFLNKLSRIRTALDTSLNYSANAIMQYYTNAIFRLNTLNSIASSSNTFLQPVYKDLVAQKTLFEMITVLGILRTNIYNVLYTRQYMVETVIGTLGVHDIFKTYETEFLLKASPASVKLYNEEKDSSALKPTMAYIDTLYKTFKFDSTYNAEQWWDISTKGTDVLKKQQLHLWHNVETGLNKIYQEEKSAENRTLIFLIIAIILVVSLVVFTIGVISQMLRELKVAAQKISVGGTGLRFHNMPNDVMGSLAQSILEIDKNNIQLAHAASAIGSGNFDVPVMPRSDEDLLGNSIERMKNDLQKLTMEKDKVQQETLELMDKKDDFLSIASHELKTPLTSLKAYSQLLHMDSKDSANSKREMMLSKMDAQVDKLTSLITNLLDTSKLQNGKLIYNENVFQLNDLVIEIVDEIQAIASSHQIVIKNNTPAQVYADRERIGQVLSNFLNNAIKYCPNSKKIIVDIENNEEMAICSVQDFGIGIRQDQHEKIFERFHRVSGSNLHTYPGLGLGLFIAKEIIERHDGKIWIESEEGKGSIFYFSLPVTNDYGKEIE
jgi:signal transduction histidine kinase